MPSNNTPPSHDVFTADELFSRQQYREAIEAYRKLLERPGENKITLLEKLGWSCYLDNQYKEALRYFQWYDSLSPNEITIKTMIGLCSFETQDFQQAKSILSTVIQDPLAPEEAHATLIRTLIRLGEPFENYLQNWWNTPNITPQLTYSIATDLIETNLSQAEAFLEIALSRFPDDNFLCYGMAICCLKQGNLEKASFFCEKILTSDSEQFPLATLIVALHKIHSHETEKASLLIRQAQEKGWLDSEWHKQLASAWKNIDEEKAREHLWQAITLQPNDNSLWFAYLDTFSSSKQEKEFLFACKQAYEHTKNPNFLKTAGAFALSLQDYSTAIFFLQKAQEIAPDQETKILLIMALFSSEKQTDTIITLASSLTPNEEIPPYAAYCIGKTYLSIGETETAFSWFSQALKKYPNDPNLLYGLSLVEMEHHQWERAKDYLGRALSFTNHPNLFYALALCHLQTKDISGALSFFLSACEAKKDAEFCYNIALLLIRNGYKKQAVHLLRKTLEFNPSHTEAHAYLQFLTSTQESKK